MPDLSKLLTPKTIGCFTHCEVTEIVMMGDAKQPPQNVFTLLVAEERTDTPDLNPGFLGCRIRLSGLKGFAFGIYRYIMPLDAVVAELAKFEEAGQWSGSGKCLHFGELHKLPPQFVAPDSSTYPPWNRVLKNNFWNGSYVAEWSDRKKAALNPFFEDARLLQELTTEIQKEVPIDLAALSDRLGNFVFQLPVTAIMSEFVAQRSGDCLVKIAWHSQIPPRPIRAVAGYEFDSAITGFSMGSVSAPETLMKTTGTRGRHSGIIWDEQNELILAASGPTGFVEVIHMNIAPMDHEPRVVTYTDNDGIAHSERISLMGGGPALMVGNPDGDETGGRTIKRLYQSRLDELKRTKAFETYGASGASPQDERKRALEDVKFLMRQHGRIGVWLWDPFLNSYDILETLIFCPYSSSELRGLTNTQEPPPDCTTEAVPPQSVLTRSQRFVQNQRTILDNVQSNWRGVRLEFRARTGGAGWGFHDRFLIFPQASGPALAWSLGTSVNSLGGDHHILQKVEDGQLIMDAFRDLWEQLDGPDYLIWKKP